MPAARDLPPYPNPARPARLYPAAQPDTTPPQVDLTTDYTEHYAAGGYPDFESAGLDYAAGQRAAARAQENRTALHADDSEGVHPAGTMARANISHPPTPAPGAANG